MLPHTLVTGIAAIANGAVSGVETEQAGTTRRATVVDVAGGSAWQRRRRWSEREDRGRADAASAADHRAHRWCRHRLQPITCIIDVERFLCKRPDDGGSTLEAPEQHPGCCQMMPQALAGAASGCRRPCRSISACCAVSRIRFASSCAGIPARAARDQVARASRRTAPNHDARWQNADGRPVQGGLRALSGGRRLLRRRTVHRAGHRRSIGRLDHRRHAAHGSARRWRPDARARAGEDALKAACRDCNTRITTGNMCRGFDARSQSRSAQATSRSASSSIRLSCPTK